MNEYQLRTQVLASDLKANEKVVMFAIIMKVDWKTFKGQVSVSQIVEMTSNSIPTVKRILSQLIKKKWIKRTSKHIERERSTAAYTEILYDNIKNDTSIKSDTPTVSNLIPPSIKTDTVKGIKNDTHTISNNYISISNNTVETETHDIKEVDQVSIEGGGNDEFWVFPSSIQDPIKRRNTENYILSRNTPLSYAERQRLLHPELCKPILNN